MQESQTPLAMSACDPTTKLKQHQPKPLKCIHANPRTIYITSIPTTATNTAKSEPCNTFSVPCDAPLPVFTVDGPCTNPVDAEPDALDTEFPLLPLLPLLEPDPELLESEPLLPRCPSVPGPAPERPGTVATSLVAAALLELAVAVEAAEAEEAECGKSADMFVPVPSSDFKTVLSLLTEMESLVPALEV